MWLKLTVRNDGMLWVPSYQLGVVGYAHGMLHHTDLRRRIGVPEGSLLSEVDVPPCNRSWVPEPHVRADLQHASVLHLDRLPPFQRDSRSIAVQLPRAHRQEALGRWWGGVYVAPENGPPTWAQVVFDYYAEGGSVTTASVRTLRRDRPVVWWGRADEPPEDTQPSDRT